MRPTSFNPWPFGKPRPKEQQTRPEERMKRDLRALEEIQKSRPKRPPGKHGR